MSTLAWYEIPSNVTDAAISEYARFGLLTVIKMVSAKKYRCACDCGNTVDICRSNLLTGHKKTCGECIGGIRIVAGMRFGRLVAISRHASGQRCKWVCRCDCGNTIETIASPLVDRHTLSCGCLRRDRAVALKYSHGMRRTPEYSVWCDIKKRCHNPKSSGYYKYGERGISVCDRWRNSFADFFADMGPRPTAKHSIDRINNYGNYEPGNCRWATAKEQAANQRPRSEWRFKNADRV